MNPGARWTTAALLSAGAAAVSWQAIDANRQQGCWTPEDIAMPHCEAKDPGQAERERLRRNPGDGDAWVRLAHSQQGQVPGVLQAAATLMPTDPNVLLLSAGQALKAGRFDLALEPLFRTVEMYHHQAPQAAAVLAMILAMRSHDAAFHAKLEPGSRWLQPVLGGLAAAKLPRLSALDLVAQGWKRGAVTDAQVQAYMGSLKAEGAWAEAYSLWRMVHGAAVPLLFNGGFEMALGQGAFNWETPAGATARLGGVLRRRADAQRGNLVEIQFNGRPMAQPLLRQPLSLAPGDYLLRGRYNVSRLKSEHGLAWVVRCIQPPREVAGKSPALLDTQGAWKAFEARLNVTPDCGPGAHIQLEPYEAYEARVGVRGMAQFDDLELQRLGP